MKTTNSILDKITQLTEASIEYATISLLLAMSVLFVSASWRKNHGYFFSAVIFGTVLGLAASNTPAIAHFDYLLAVLGTITGPSTLAALQHKDLFQLLESIKKLRKDK